MGGLGSGPRKKLGRRTVDSTPVLDVNDLSAAGRLTPGWAGICRCVDDAPRSWYDLFRSRESEPLTNLSEWASFLNRLKRASGVKRGRILGPLRPSCRDRRRLESNSR